MMATTSCSNVNQLNDAAKAAVDNYVEENHDALIVTDSDFECLPKSTEDRIIDAVRDRMW